MECVSINYNIKLLYCQRIYYALRLADRQIIRLSVQFSAILQLEGAFYT